MGRTSRRLSGHGVVAYTPPNSAQVRLSVAGQRRGWVWVGTGGDETRFVHVAQLSAVAAAGEFAWSWVVFMDENKATLIDKMACLVQYRCLLQRLHVEASLLLSTW